MERRTSAARPVSAECASMVEVAVIEIGVVEAVAIDDRSAVGDVGVVVVDDSMAMPVTSPVMPAPAKSSEEADSKSKPEGNCRTVKKDSGNWVPTRVGDDGRPVHEPGIIGRNIDDLRIGRFDDGGVPLRRYLLLFIAIQVAGLLSLLTHCLDGVCHILLLVGVCVAKR